MKKIKYSKIAIVVFLTALIWVGADLSLDEDITLYDINIKTTGIRTKQWINFDGNDSIAIVSVTLSGPASKISEVASKRENDSLNLEFTFEAEEYGINTPGVQKQDVAEIISNIDWIRDMSLKVVSCKPETIDVNVVQLEQKELTVEVYDSRNNLLDPNSIVPETVYANVPTSWSDDELRARVNLTETEKEEAKKAGITKTPFIMLGQKRDLTTRVTITLPAESSNLSNYPIPAPLNLTFAMSQNLLGKYRVEVINQDDLTNRSITIRATQAAYDTYMSQERAKLTLHIPDSAAESGNMGGSAKPVCNFPEEYVRKNEISLVNTDIIELIYRLIPNDSEVSTNGERTSSPLQ